MSQVQSLDSRSGETPVAETGEEPLYLGLRLSSWIKIGTVSGLMIALFWPNLRRLWEKTNPFYGEPNWGHSIFVPIIGLYYLYVHRDELRAAKAKTAWTGLFFLVLGILIFGYGIWPGQNDFIKDFGMPVTLMGIVLLLSGYDVMKTAWFPIAFLVCAIPWPDQVYSRIASPLQVLAARVAVWTLQLTGVSSFDYGTKIFIHGYGNALRTLNVAEACAGLRSLMTFVTVAGAVAFLSSRPLWQKLIVTVSAIPIAIFCNVVRVSGQGLLDHYVSQQLSESFAHKFVGLIMLIPAFLLILLVGWLLDRLFVEEVETKWALSDGLVRRRPAPIAPAPRMGKAAGMAAAETDAPVPGRSLAEARRARAAAKPAAAPPQAREGA